VRLLYLAVIVLFSGLPLNAQEANWLSPGEFLEFYKQNNNVCVDYRSDNTCSVLESNLYLGDENFVRVSRIKFTKNTEARIVSIERIFSNKHCLEYFKITNSKQLIKSIGKESLDRIFEAINTIFAKESTCTKLKALPGDEPLGNKYLAHTFADGVEITSSTVKVLDDPDDVRLRIQGVPGIVDLE